MIVRLFRVNKWRQPLFFSVAPRRVAVCYGAKKHRVTGSLRVASPGRPLTRSSLANSQQDQSCGECQKIFSKWVLLADGLRFARPQALQHKKSTQHKTQGQQLGAGPLRMLRSHPGDKRK
jgi:hypothetical protein